MKIIKTIKGLKCDNPNCYYVDPDILREQYESYIGYPCPKCGWSLLTQESYDKLLKLEDKMNFLAKMLGTQVQDASDGELANESDSTAHGVQIGFGLNDKGNYKVNKMKLF